MIFNKSGLGQDSRSRWSGSLASADFQLEVQVKGVISLNDVSCSEITPFLRMTAEAKLLLSV